MSPQHPTPRAGGPAAAASPAPVPRTLRRALLPAALALLVGSTAACGDDPFALEWMSAPDTAALFSLALPEIGLPSAFSFNERRTIEIEDPSATGRWDLALDTRGGQLVFLPPGALSINSRARIAPLGSVAFGDVLEAPGDTAAYVSDEPVPVEVGHVYVVQTGESAGSFGTRCVFFAKLEPLTADPETGRVEFQYDSNPICNDTDLVPPDER